VTSKCGELITFELEEFEIPANGRQNGYEINGFTLSIG
jgi:hypothetical protein